LRAGGAEGVVQGGTGFRGAALVHQNQDQVSAGLDQPRVQLQGAADQRLGFARPATRGQRGSRVAELRGNGYRVSSII
jgi:hypothetical protein